MDFYKPDLWELGSDPCTITSFLKLSFTDGNLLGGNKTIITQNCGLGWRFHVSTSDSETSQAFPTFTISFIPHLITAATLRRLHRSVKHCDDLKLESLDNRVIDLPTTSQYIPLASFTLKETFTKEATVDITLSFSTSFSLSLATDSPTRKVQRNLSSQLNGELCDARFCLFTRRGQTNEVIHPQIIFADSALLRGHCVQLDSILDGKANYGMVTGYNIPNRAHKTYDYESDSDLQSDSGDNVSINHTAVRECRQLKGDEQAILIDDVAFQTWKAFMMYIYTKEISFLPLTPSTEPISSPEDLVACSPKSMYRLAVKMGSEELQTLALNAINQGLSDNNIIEELFCRFTSTYPEVQKIEVDYLVKHLTPVLFDNLAEKLKSVVAGQLPHCHEVLVAAMYKMHFDGSNAEVAPELDPIQEQAACPNLPSLPSPPDWNCDVVDKSQTTKHPKTVEVEFIEPSDWDFSQPKEPAESDLSFQSRPVYGAGSKRGKISRRK